MAGSHTEKFRGVHAKFWADLRIYLDTAGLRVNLRKPQGLFNKISRPNRYPYISAVGSRSRGSGLMGPCSNLVRWFWIQRSGFARGAGTALGRRRPLPAAACHRELAGLRCFGVPGIKTEQIWVRKGLRDMRSPPGTRSGHERVCGGANRDGGGSGRLHSPACGVLWALGATAYPS